MRISKLTILLLLLSISAYSQLFSLNMPPCGISSITGTLSVTTTTTTQLTDATFGGIWKSNTTSVATVNSSGLVTGVSAGASTISYSLSSICYSTVVVTVTSSTTTWDASKKSTHITLSGGNLTASCSTSGGSNGYEVMSVAGHSSGKYYWETTDNTDAGSFVGISLSTASVDNGCGLDANSWGYQGATGFKWNNISPASYGSTYTTGAVINHALDIGAGKYWVGKNGVWQASGNPATGANPTFSGLIGTMYAACGTGGTATGQVWIANFGGSAYMFTPPTGFNNL